MPPEPMTGDTPLPVQLSVAGPAQQRRWTVLIRLIMLIPHLFVLLFLSIAAEVVAFIGWWGALFTGRLPKFAVSYLSGWVRWYTRVQAYEYLLTDQYPPFSFDDEPGYPVRIAVPPRDKLNRVAVFFRFILVIPAGLLNIFLVNGGLTIVAFIAWIIALITGKLPTSLHLAYTAVLRFTTRYTCYSLLLTAAYPGGVFGDGLAAPYGVAVPPVGDLTPAAPGSEAPVEAGEAPVEAGEAPVEASEAPVDAAAPGSEASVEAEETPVEVGESPVDAAAPGFEASVVAEEGPVEAGEAPEAPVEAEETPVEADEAPVDAAAPGSEAPVEAEEGPVEAGQAPVEVGEVPVDDAESPAESAVPGFEAPADPAAWQPADWRLILTRGAKQLVGWFIAIGAVLWVASIVLNAVGAFSTHPNNAVLAKNAIAAVKAANNTLASAVNNYQTTAQSCTDASCIETADGRVGAAFTNFASTVHGTPMPSSAAAAANRLYSDATKVGQDLTQLSHLSSTVSPTQYNNSATSIGLGQATTQFQQDFTALSDALNSVH
jgi:Domain of unknown function (DUF4389)